MNQFISPNWHVALIHYPIALLSLGLLVELINLIRTHEGFRAAGRWMILLGALLSVPALTSGLYAFRDAVTDYAISTGETWADVVEESDWSDAQWAFMSRHVWLNSSATALFLIVVALWIAGSDLFRRKAYWPLLLALVAGNVLMILGAWHGGEAVYRFGTAVEQPVPEVRDWEYYAPPLQSHLIFVGLSLAITVLALGLMVRQWQQPRVDPDAPAETTLPPPRIYPGTCFVVGSLLAIIAAFFGAWSTMHYLSREALEFNLEKLADPEHRRLLAHVIAGLIIIALPLVLAIFVRFFRRLRRVAMILSGVLVVALALQIWFGVALLYDGHAGRLYRFGNGNHVHAEPEATHEHEH